MKKRLIYNLAFAVILTFSMSSCKKQLEKYPYSSIELSQSFQTVKDAETWNNGLYAMLRGRVYGIFMFTKDVQADQLNASRDYGNRNGFPHRWDGFLAGDYTIRDVWATYYEGITNANIMLEGFPKIETSVAADQAKLKRYTGDAHLARAFYYTKLVSLFAKPYEPQTAASDLGVPLILTYDVELKPARATVQEVYNQILADIAAAKTNLANVEPAEKAQRFNKYTVLALEARVKLYMQDWAGAKAAADELIASGNYPLIKDQAGLMNYWHKDGAQESILQLFVSKPNELPNTNGIYLGYNPANNKYTPDFIPSEWVIEEFPASDHRKAVYFEELPVYIQGNDYTLTLVDKYPGNPAYFTAATTNYAHEPKVFRIAEMYLISAEAGARGTTGAADALDKLNQLRTARGLTALSGLSGDALFNAVKEERFRELAFEGFRFLDLKRWHQGFTRRDPQASNALMSGEGYQNLTIPADADKFVWGIPSNDVTVNPNIVQNKGW